MLLVAMIKQESSSISITYDAIIADDVDKNVISNFCCGKKYFDGYFRDHEAKAAKTYAWLNVENNEAIALASIACSGLVHNTGAGNIHVWPAIYIECFAVNRKYQDYKQTIDGEVVLLSADILAYLIWDIIYGKVIKRVCHADYIILDSVPDAVRFYELSGFKKYEDCFQASKTLDNQDCVPMYYSFY